MADASENAARRRLRDDDAIDFGELPPAVNEILQRGVALHRVDRAAADRAFREALALDPRALATYFCLYKIHTYAGDLDAALEAAEAGAREAARQANLSPDWRLWEADAISLDGPGRFALYTLKALAFIRLRRDEPCAADEVLAHLARLDPADAVGGSVVAAIRRGVEA
ncbi:MAG: hypothetical protein GX458_00550 [Phyllobacteriaceae bacterium]|nr:hypothetical protein [Phyllobacteriaceae bacterium]